MPTYLSERDLPLVYTGGPPADRPVLTVENYVKWYTLYAVCPDGCVIPIDTTARPGFASSWRDHVPHPAACVRYAEQVGWDWDENSLDMIFGRFAREVRDVLWHEEEF